MPGLSEDQLVILLALEREQRNQCFFFKSPGVLIVQPGFVITVSTFTKAAWTGTGLDLIKKWLQSSGGWPQSEPRPLLAH